MKISYINNNTRLTALCLVVSRWAGTRKVKLSWILLKQEAVSGSGVSWLYASLHLAADRQMTTTTLHPPTTQFLQADCPYNSVKVLKAQNLLHSGKLKMTCTWILFVVYIFLVVYCLWNGIDWMISIIVSCHFSGSWLVLIWSCKLL